MTERRFAPGALVALLFVLSPPLAARGEGGAPAPAAPEETRLDEVVVHLPRAPAAPGSATSVVDADRFAGEAKSVAELVATAPGVAVNEAGGPGQLATASIRGSTSDGVLVLLDGLPLGTAFGGGVDLASVPRQWISRLEVVRGVEGARFGSGALGGALNVVTRRPQAGRFGAQLSTGSFGTWSAGADGAAGGDRGGVLVSLGYDRTDGDFPYLYDPAPSVGGNPLVGLVRTHAAAQRGGALVKGFLDAGGGRIDALAQLSAGARELPGWPHALTPDDRQDDLRVLSAVRFARPAWEGAVWRAEASVRHDGLDARLAALGGATARQRGTAATLRSGLVARAGAHALSLGAEAGGEEMTASGLGDARRRATFAASAADDLALAGDRVRVRPALRVERVGPFAGWSASAGADARVAGPLSVRASAGRTFRAPGFAELFLEQGLLAPNPALVPEEAIGGSAGLAAEGRLGLASATAFATLYRDLIVYQAATFQRLRPYNAGKATVRGVELEAASAPVGPLRASASLAYTLLLSENLRGEDAVVGRELPRRPRHRLYARAAAAPGPLEVHAESQLVGRQFLDARNLAVVPRALTFGAGASLRVARRPDVRVHLDVRNLLDDRTLEDGFGNPLPSRMVLVGLRVGSPQEGTP